MLNTHAHGSKARPAGARGTSACARGAPTWVQLGSRLNQRSQVAVRGGRMSVRPSARATASILRMMSTCHWTSAKCSKGVAPFGTCPATQKGQRRVRDGSQGVRRELAYHHRTTTAPASCGPLVAHAVQA
eukprot:2925577-Pyramimonas_sp.AAC.2